MGRITIFVTESCSYCIRAKHALKERNIPYVEISVSKYPQRRNDMISLSNDQYTVPQVFFNSKHVGGCTELLATLEEWDKNCDGTTNYSGITTTPLAMYLTIVESQADPTDPRLQLPVVTPVSTSASVGVATKTSARTNDRNSLISTATATTFSIDSDEEEGEEEDEEQILLSAISKDAYSDCFVTLPNQQVVSLGDFTSELLNVIPCYHKLAFGTKYYYNCVTGKEIVDSLLNHYPTKLKNRQYTLKFCQQFLLSNKEYAPLLHQVVGGHTSRLVFEDSLNVLYRLQPYHEPYVLNSFYQYPRETPGNHNASDPMSIIQRLQSILQYLERKYSNSRDGMDHVGARADPKFQLLEKISCQLQMVDMSIMGTTERTAFCLNLYNIMIQHAFIKLGIAKSSSQRSTIFKQVSCQLRDADGDDGNRRIILSLDDIEHGILRANTKHPYALRPQFHPTTQAVLISNLSLKKIDPRIHFALNCGANSCPPINYYTPDHLKQELDLAAVSFCGQDCNIKLDETKNVIECSMILKWYKNDFGIYNISQDLPPRILPFLRGAKKERLARMVHKQNSGGGSIKVKFFKYDWGTNSSRHESFTKSDLETSKTSIGALFRQYSSSSSLSSKSKKSKKNKNKKTNLLMKQHSSYSPARRSIDDDIVEEVDEEAASSTGSATSRSINGGAGGGETAEKKKNILTSSSSPKNTYDNAATTTCDTKTLDCVVHSFFL